VRSPADKPRDPALSAPERLVTVATYSEPLEAQIGRANLASHGIHAFIADEHLSTLNPHYIGAALGIRLQVLHPDLERASEILKSTPEDDDSGDTEEEDEAAAELDGPKCPRCEARYSYKEWSLDQLVLIVVLLGLPLLFLQKRWHCRKCDASWPPETASPKRGNPYRAPRRSALREKR
jgi:hypothetical protein